VYTKDNKLIDYLFSLSLKRYRALPEQKFKEMRMKRKNFLRMPAGRRVLAGAMLVTIFLLAPVSLFAADGDLSTTLGDKVNIVLEIIGSPWVKGVACIALIAECIGLLTAGRQEPGMFKKFIPWIAGTLLFLAAGAITNQFMGTMDGKTFSDVLPSSTTSKGGG
jgi:type IV secretory pathway VirB2 component (pilin)